MLRCVVHGETALGAHFHEASIKFITPIFSSAIGMQFLDLVIKLYLQARLKRLVEVESCVLRALQVQT